MSDVTMSVTTMLLLGIAGWGLALVGLRLVILLFRLNINAPVFSAQIVKLVAADNIDRALKLASVVPQTPVGAAIKAVLDAWVNGARETSSLKHAMERDMGGVGSMMAKGMWFSPAGAFIALGTCGYGYVSGLSGDDFLYLVGISGAAVVLAGLGELKAQGIRKAAEQGVELTIQALFRHERRHED